jgi:hypothetical protein
MTISRSQMAKQIANPPSKKIRKKKPKKKKIRSK